MTTIPTEIEHQLPTGAGEPAPSTIITEEESTTSEGYDSVATPRSNLSRSTTSRRQARPLSPATPAEHFFLTDQFFLPDNIGLTGFGSPTAAAAAASARRPPASRQPPSSKNSIASGFSTSTDDFQSACEDSEIGDTDRYEDVPPEEIEAANPGSSGAGFFGKDILVVSRRQIIIPEESDEDLNRVEGSLKMTKEESAQSVVAPKATMAGVDAPPAVAKTAPPKVSTPAKVSVDAVEESEAHFDVTQHMYSAAKNVWSFGRSIPVGGAILGLYEAAAGKVLDVIAHKDLPGLDSDIKPHLASLDKDVIDPAVLAIIKFFAPAVEKGSEVVGPVVSPIVMTVLKIFPKQIEGGEGEKEEEETAKLKEAEKEATMPEVSTPLAAPIVTKVN